MLKKIHLYFEILASFDIWIESKLGLFCSDIEWILSQDHCSKVCYAAGRRRGLVVRALNCGEGRPPFESRARDSFFRKNRSRTWKGDLISQKLLLRPRISMPGMRNICGTSFCTEFWNGKCRWQRPFQTDQLAFPLMEKRRSLHTFNCQWGILHTLRGRWGNSSINQKCGRLACLSGLQGKNLKLIQIYNLYHVPCCCCEKRWGIRKKRAPLRGANIKK